MTKCFQIQTIFFPNLPDDGPLLDFLHFFSWFIAGNTMLLLNAACYFFNILYWTILNFGNTLVRKSHNFSKHIWSLSPFSRVTPSISTPILYTSFLTDQECIAKCYDSEQEISTKFLNFMSQKSESVYVDNCANCHITNTKEHFISYTPYEDSDYSRFVHTIGGGTKPLGEGTVHWSWRNDDGKICKYDLPGCRYYPDSPVCILSQTQLGIFLNDQDFGTKIESGIRTLIFYWDGQKNKRTIHHTPSFMPKMIINDDFFSACNSVFLFLKIL